jgi:hypothetical protein
MQELAKPITSFLYGQDIDRNVLELKNIVVVFDGSHNSADSCDIIHKFRNIYGKWAFKWIKKQRNSRQEFMSGYEYDDILSIKNNRLVFVKDGVTGFWYFNTRTEFIYP